MTPLRPVPPELADLSGIDPAVAARLAAQLQQISSPAVPPPPVGATDPPAPQARVGLRGSRTLLSAVSSALAVVVVVYLSTPTGGVTPPEVAQYAILALGAIPAALAARSGVQALHPQGGGYPQPPQSYPQPQGWPPATP